jgi:hypothetical protein
MYNPHVQTNSITPDGLFLQGLREDSNLEMDWLWLATRVSSDGQRRYCLQRALTIHPESHLARRGLSHLQRHPGKPLTLE